MSTVDEIVEAASHLSAEDQLRIATHLMNQACPVDPKIQQAWIDEANRRLREIEEGKVELLDGDEVMRELRSHFNAE